ncbi:hypothetical protein PUR61_40855 [Streptomyces sp. BE20]|uniref:hypothetical protein n=1 Tax=Streptomyces sp. BE20 TaxID=3002525 RepID=UPI002E779246|nr:hypothetical protein [Streptomyces sp. BE20]MEE1828472.1 hypothetical protein [Streptomyces sp. BE20]
MRTPVVRVASSSSAPVPAPVRASVPALGPDAVPEPDPEPDPEPVTGAARGADAPVPVRFDRYEHVTAALADPALVPVPAAPGPVGGAAWLRATVARFGAGERHAVRRAGVEADLARLDPDALRASAAAGSEPDAGLRAVRVLAQALGLAEPDAVGRAVAAVARVYFVERPDDPEADAAVAWLLPRMLPDEEPVGRGGAGAEAERRPAEHGAAAVRAAEERAANRIGLLVQSFDATATLVDHARRAVGSGADPIDAALRHDPPVRTMRRHAVRDTEVGGVPVPAGAQVVLDVAAAQAGRPGLPPLTFGAPPRLCPGRIHALAIASGILHGAADPAGSSPDAPDPDPDGLVPGPDAPAPGGDLRPHERTAR